MPFVPRPWFYSVDRDTFTRHVRSCTYHQLVALRDELEDTIESCERVRKRSAALGEALRVNETRMGVVERELSARAGAALAGDTRDRARRDG